MAVDDASSGAGSSRNEHRVHIALWTMAAFAIGHAAWFTMSTARQLPLDDYAFRQAQTAISSAWMLRTPFSLAYETPVGGAPWSIPFELPIYQWIVALAAYVSGVPVHVAGRVTSFAFLLACVAPAARIVRELELPRTTLPTFLALLFASPLYLYWGRAVMIETAAVFFGLAAIALFLPVLRGTARARIYPAFAAAMAASILQKATTGLPIVLVLGVSWLVTIRPTWRDPERRRAHVYALTSLVIPIVLGAIWTVYTDVVKARSPLGSVLTSRALHLWNWGTLAQRASSALYVDVIGRRLLRQNAGGPLGLALIVGAIGLPHTHRLRALAAASVSLTLLPLFAFTNLHIVHRYYQAGCAIFLLGALALAIAAWLPKALSSPMSAPVVLLVMLGSNAAHFFASVRELAYATWAPDETPILRVANDIRRGTRPSSAFVAYGLDWSSELGYLAERRSFSVPPFWGDAASRARLLRDPEAFLGDAPLGAIVDCGHGADAQERRGALMSFARTRHWAVTTPLGCLLLLPERAATAWPTYEIGAPIELRDGKAGLAFVHHGFAAAEPDFTWTDGHDAELLLRLVRPWVDGDGTLAIDAIPFLANGALPEQRLVVSINGYQLGEHAFDVVGFSRARFAIPGELLRRARGLRIRLSLPDARRGTDVGVADDRVLGLAIATVTLERAAP